MADVVSAPKNHNNGYPKIAISTPITNSTTNEMIDHGHNLARKLRMKAGRCTRHQFNDRSIEASKTKISPKASDAT